MIYFFFNIVRWYKESFVWEFNYFWELVEVEVKWFGLRY